MSSTYLSLHYHIVFSTKGRTPSIDIDWRSRLHEYLGGLIRGLGGVPECVGGVADHVHLLVGLKATHCLADFMRDMKKSATAWIRNELGQGNFAWQEGYSAFTVSPTSRKNVWSYIENQEHHHRQLSYREELIELLQKADVAFDERYFD